MWRWRSGRALRSQRCLSVCGFSTGATGGDGPLAPVKLYVIAGEASGDAIGAKVIRALLRHQPPQSLEFRGIGGPQMCLAGGFESLFPMQDLSVMGLVEVVPHLWRFRRRIQDTLRDIEAFQPELVLTIDSKGFTFRVLKALQASEERTGGKRIKKAHYVAPSVWAYKHRGKRDFTELKQLLDVMFTILPFEEDMFRAGEKNQSSRSGEDTAQSWCHFVGHPAVEDFLEVHGAYDRISSYEDAPTKTTHQVETGADALLDLSKFSMNTLFARGRISQALAATGREPNSRARARKEFDIPPDAFVICALVGSRANEVKKSARLVLDAIIEMKRTSTSMREKNIYVVFPTIAAVEEQVNSNISPADPEVECHVLTDLDAVARLRLFQGSDLAVAVSGTIVLETTLANLPTVVIYRANKVTEWIAQRLAAVRFVSIPNLLLGRSLLPELLFSDCTALNIADALGTLHGQPLDRGDALHLAMAVSTLTKWRENNGEPATRADVAHLLPIRASDVAAKHILSVLKN
ncbi:hypothetical protein PF005_g4573 [Phytophthora fragariae]|uniref:lipid-A-disaccharide synthase n=1 Tax=Phytophthora fragariae TaxID=53985 RepID=A0A6A3T4K4_9STRA|nr:hypothetical protein PF003_g1158 [Phytophthora fragariae]KAE8945204.1 hypothetical protein PF009_g5138 [Phytophthora fragariae]KAE9126587.1 hypothetical protein PF007_g5911 [Phytophthora fragariae]KAE9151642.1 hypothetical protein PF006_g4069 [Phytophthora fragariae]KAE9227784.1 hypothetical protein PF005_g4573 [Phytophthora fragariae]